MHHQQLLSNFSSSTRDLSFFRERFINKKITVRSPSPRHFVQPICSYPSGAQSPRLSPALLFLCRQLAAEGFSVFASFYKPDANISRRFFLHLAFLQSFRVGRSRFLTSYWWSSLLRAPPRLPERSAGPERRTRRGEQADASGCGESVWQLKL